MYTDLGIIKIVTTTYFLLTLHPNWWGKNEARSNLVAMGAV